ncbi:MAG: hypothetical protein DMG92_11085 [Acidobacteria bacterium]|nr:MAG: hypothetical protein DMG92_11085 [Acidobacteriota bacterium]
MRRRRYLCGSCGKRTATRIDSARISWCAAGGKHSRRRSAGISKTVSWHVFRHTFSTLLVGNGEDVKTAQSLMRHANANITMTLYTHPVSSKKREAQAKIVEMIRPREMAPVAVMARGTA